MLGKWEIRGEMMGKGGIMRTNGGLVNNREKQKNNWENGEKWGETRDNRRKCGKQGMTGKTYKTGKNRENDGNTKSLHSVKHAYFTGLKIAPNCFFTLRRNKEIPETQQHHRNFLVPPESEETIWGSF